MEWLNLTGLCSMAIILLPNILFAGKRKGASFGKISNKVLTLLEQTGRYGCMAFLVFNIPCVRMGFWFPYAHTVCLVGNGMLLAAYLVCWAVYWNKMTTTGAVLLSAIPTAIFLFWGIAPGNIPLLLSAVIFGVCHISIAVKSCKDAIKPQGESICTTI